MSYITYSISIVISILLGILGVYTLNSSEKVTISNKIDLEACLWLLLISLIPILNIATGIGLLATAFQVRYHYSEHKLNLKRIPFSKDKQ